MARHRRARPRIRGRELQAVEAGHPEVGHDRLERTPCSRLLPARRRPMASAVGDHAEMLELGDEDPRGSWRCRRRRARAVPRARPGRPRALRTAPTATAACAPAPGSSSVNVLPSPGTPALSATSDPSISSERRRLIASPRPVPPNRRAIDASAWLNDWKSRPIRSGGMPMPVSRDREPDLPAPRRRRTRRPRRRVATRQRDDDLATSP